MNNKNDFTILSGSDLTNLNSMNDVDFENNEIKNSNWLQFDYFMKGKDEQFDKIITYLGNEDGKNFIKAYSY